MLVFLPESVIKVYRRILVWVPPGPMTKDGLRMFHDHFQTLVDSVVETVSHAAHYSAPFLFKFVNKSTSDVRCFRSPTGSTWLPRFIVLVRCRIFHVFEVAEMALVRHQQVKGPILSTTWFKFVVSLVEPNISFEFVPIPRPHPSSATYAHPCYSNCAHVFKNCNISNNIAPMPTQTPWAWVGMGTQCRAPVIGFLTVAYLIRANCWIN